MKPIRIGILGGGSNSAVGQVHLSALRMDGKYTIGPCLFSHLESENRESHAFFGVPWKSEHLSLPNWLDRFKSELDLLAILTPSPMHAEHIRIVANHSVPFVVEKPVACSMDEVNRTSEILRLSGSKKAYFVHNYSGYPMFRELVLRAREGRIGSIHNVRVEMPSDGFARERVAGRPQPWRQVDPEVPMIMLDLGTHLHHLVSMVLGPSTSRVLSRMGRMTNSFGVVDNVEIWESRDDGIEVSYWMSKAHLGEKNGLRVAVFGSEGSLIWRQMEPDILVQADIDSNVSIVNRGSAQPGATTRSRFKAGHPTGFVEAFANYYSDLADDFQSQRANPDPNSWIRPIQEALMGVGFLAAATRSSKTGDWELIS
jgi:predicted dehydrogenase